MVQYIVDITMSKANFSAAPRVWTNYRKKIGGQNFIGIIEIALINLSQGSDGLKAVSELTISKVTEMEKDAIWTSLWHAKA